MWLLKDTGSWQATLTSLIYGFPGCLVIAILAHRRWGKIDQNLGDINPVFCVFCSTS